MGLLSAACQQLTVVIRRSVDRYFPVASGDKANGKRLNEHYTSAVCMLHLGLSALQAVNGLTKMTGNVMRVRPAGGDGSLLEARVCGLGRPVAQRS